MKNIQLFWKKYSFVILILFLTAGIFDVRFSIAAIVCMAGPILLSFFKGRYWCGNICPRGSFYDNVVSKFSSKKEIPKFLKSIIFRIIVFTAMMSFFITNLIKNWGNMNLIGLFFYRMILVTTIVGLILSLFYNHRTWCSFCPMGSAASFISHFIRNKKALKIDSSCVSCKVCSNNCPMGINPHTYKTDTISHPDCIQCGVCAAKCPKNCIK